MKVDFSKLELETRIDQFDNLDLREDVGNIVFATATTIAEDELARRIYKSKGPVELTEREYEMLMQSLRTNQVAFRLVSAIERQVKQPLESN